MFQIIGAMAEFERSLIQERVRAGIRNARAKGKRLGRSVVGVDVNEVVRLRTLGLDRRRLHGDAKGQFLVLCSREKNAYALAFVALRDGFTAREQELRDAARCRIAD